ncbi:hypothetical protein [Polycladidibacter stylochi]|uniref:hypothetical protein n=1 Tax=Polycladidibacter stylochi TaxID=1807766 RepID=UPI000ABE203B|nr:hypothetical protein [Pseudovibrio stylochi]
MIIQLYHKPQTARKTTILQLLTLSFLGICLTVLSANGASLEQKNISSWYQRMGGLIPVKNKIYICHGYGCKYRTKTFLSPTAHKKAIALLRQSDKTPEQERAAIKKLIAWHEVLVATKVGSANDRGGLDMQNGGVRGQMDCIDETANTTSVLLYATQQGWFVHHRVVEPVSRGFFLDLRYPHASAAIEEIATGKKYVVDNWPDDNGKPPLVIPLEAWRGQGG